MAASPPQRQPGIQIQILLAVIGQGLQRCLGAGLEVDDGYGYGYEIQSTLRV